MKIDSKVADWSNNFAQSKVIANLRRSWVLRCLINNGFRNNEETGPPSATQRTSRRIFARQNSADISRRIFGVGMRETKTIALTTAGKYQLFPPYPRVRTNCTALPRLSDILPDFSATVSEFPTYPGFQIFRKTRRPQSESGNDVRCQPTGVACGRWRLWSGSPWERTAASPGRRAGPAGETWGTRWNASWTSESGRCFVYCQESPLKQHHRPYHRHHHHRPYHHHGAGRNANSPVYWPVWVGAQVYRTLTRSSTLPTFQVAEDFALRAATASFSLRFTTKLLAAEHFRLLALRRETACHRRLRRYRLWRPSAVDQDVPVYWIISWHSAHLTFLCLHTVCSGPYTVFNT